MNRFSSVNFRVEVGSGKARAPVAQDSGRTRGVRALRSTRSPAAAPGTPDASDRARGSGDEWTRPRREGCEPARANGGRGVAVGWFAALTVALLAALGIGSRHRFSGNLSAVHFPLGVFFRRIRRFAAGKCSSSSEGTASAPAPGTGASCGVKPPARRPRSPALSRRRPSRVEFPGHQGAADPDPVSDGLGGCLGNALDGRFGARGAQLVGFNVDVGNGFATPVPTSVPTSSVPTSSGYSFRCWGCTSPFA